jgi:hypothetical protein
MACGFGGAKRRREKEATKGREGGKRKATNFSNDHETIRGNSLNSWLNFFTQNRRALISGPPVRKVSLAKVFAQLAADGRVTQAAEGLGLDLAHALARHAHLAADLFQGISLAVQQPVAQL